MLLSHLSITKHSNIFDSTFTGLPNFLTGKIIYQGDDEGVGSVVGVGDDDGDGDVVDEGDDDGVDETGNIFGEIFFENFSFGKHSPRRHHYREKIMI